MPSTPPDGHAAREPLGPRHSAVRRLRELLRDRSARAAAGAFVVEGPRAVDAALDRDATLEAVYLGPDAEHAFARLVRRVRDAGVPVARLKEGVLERIGDTVTPQPVLAIAPVPSPGVLERDGLVLVAAGVADPGNLGTLVRGAEAAGARAIVIGPGSVDAYNPKVVRASAGAIFGVPVHTGPEGLPTREPARRAPTGGEADGGGPTGREGWTIMEALAGLRAAGRTVYATRATGGRRPDAVDLAGPVAVVVGNEARGLGDEIAPGVDGWISIPMAGSAESLNVAMAGTLVCFEAARQRSARDGGR